MMSKSPLMVAALALAAASPALAATDVVVERVGYADLDMRSPLAQAALDSRVSRAIQRVCGFVDGQRGRSDYSYRACADRAWLASRSQVRRAVGGR
jgi:UrcA family protein